jgi:hypothetical protein
MRSPSWLAALALALPLAAHAREPVRAPGPGLSPPAHGAGRHPRVEVWLPLSLEPVDLDRRGCEPRIEAAPPPEAAAERRGRHWHTGPPCESRARYRVVE